MSAGMAIIRDNRKAAGYSLGTVSQPASIHRSAISRPVRSNRAWESAGGRLLRDKCRIEGLQFAVPEIGEVNPPETRQSCDPVPGFG